MKVVLASSNPGKLEELRALLEPAGLDVVSQDAYGVEQPEETGLTFLENALIKAHAACAATGLPALADDSGVVVDEPAVQRAGRRNSSPSAKSAAPTGKAE